MEPDDKKRQASEFGETGADASSFSAELQSAMSAREDNAATPVADGYISSSSTTQADEEKIERLKRWFHLEKTTPITYLLVTANIVIFGLIVFMTEWTSLIMPSIETLLDWGALYTPAVLTGEYWRIFSSLFLHGGVLHLLLNMYVLWYIGPMVERMFGSWKFLVLYLMAGWGGAISMLIWSPAAVGVGASGAIFGLFGGLLAFLKVHKNEFPPQLFREKMRGLMMFLLINLLFGLSQPSISTAAHTGGLAIGYLIGLAIMPSAPNDLHWHWRDSLRVSFVIAFLCVVMGFEQKGLLDVGGQLSLVQGAEALKSGNYKAALPLLNKRIKKSPEDVRAYVLRAAIYLTQQDYKAALKDCDHILSIEPENVDALFTRATIYEKTEQFEKSNNDLNQVLKKKKDSASVYAMRGWNNYAIGKFKDAIEDFERTITMHPGWNFRYNSLAYCKLAIGDYKGAIADDQTFLRTAGWKDESAPYAVIVSLLANKASGDQAAAAKVLEEAGRELDTKIWQFRIIDYLAGQIDAEKFQALASDRDKMTEAKTYIGLDLLYAGKRDQARPYFQWVADHGNKQFYEYPLACAELNRPVERQNLK